jgi:hypothetical protein
VRQVAVRDIDRDIGVEEIEMHGIKVARRSAAVLNNPPPSFGRCDSSPPLRGGFK